MADQGQFETLEFLPPGFSEETNKENMVAGRPYWAFTNNLVQDRQRCAAACLDFNNAGPISRTRFVELWRRITDNSTPLSEGESDSFLNEPWVEPPIKIDYGYNVRLGDNVFINSYCALLNPCPITIGSRTLIGPNVSFYGGIHPLNPQTRAGTRGPQAGRPITIGEDCWIGGHVIIMAGVTIGNGVVVGAGSVVTKDIPNMVVVAGNPPVVLEDSTRRLLDPVFNPLDRKKAEEGLKEADLEPAEWKS